MALDHEFAHPDGAPTARQAAAGVVRPGVGLPATDTELIHKAIAFFSPLHRYHNYRVEGLENVPPKGPVLMVMHHSFATYDTLLLGATVFKETGRLPRGLGDDRIFQTPWLADKARRVGIVPASPGAGRALLDEGELVGVAPGGMWESIRPRSQAYQIRWDRRRGFCRLALEAQAPMMLAACPAADRIFKLYDNPLTERVYKRWHMPAPVLRGRGLSLMPRRVRLTHHIAPVIVPPEPSPDPAQKKAQIEALHTEACALMRTLLQRA